MWVILSGLRREREDGIGTGRNKQERMDGAGCGTRKRLERKGRSRKGEKEQRKGEEGAGGEDHTNTCPSYNHPRE